MSDSTHSLKTQIVTINDVDLTPIEVNGQRVVTLAMIDKVHGRPDGTARRAFNTHRSKMTEGKHFGKMSADEFRTRFPGIISARVTEDVTALTQRGYLMLVKSFTDDLAWQVQDALVDGYFAKSNQSVPFRRTPRIEISREARLTMSQNLRIARMIGLVGNQAVLSANQATAAMTGIDTLNLLGAPRLNAPQQAALLSPTEIGQRIGRSAREVNVMLCEIGYQTMGRDLKGHIYYEPTADGLDAGGVMQDTGKKHSTGTPVRQLRWSSSVAERIRERELLQ